MCLALLWTCFWCCSLLSCLTSNSDGECTAHIEALDKQLHFYLSFIGTQLNCHFCANTRTPNHRPVHSVTTSALISLQTWRKAHNLGWDINRTPGYERNAGLSLCATTYRLHVTNFFFSSLSYLGLQCTLAMECKMLLMKYFNRHMPLIIANTKITTSFTPHYTSHGNH